MIPIYPESCEGLAVQPFQPILLLPRFIPIAKIPTNDDIIVLAHTFLLREYSCAKPPVVPMTISGNINHIPQSPRILLLTLDFNIFSCSRQLLCTYS